MDFSAIEQFMRQIVLDSALQAAAYGGATRRAEVDAAGNLQQAVVAAVLLQLSPQIIGPHQQRYIAWVFVVRLSNDARCTVRRASIVRGLKLVDADDSRSACGELTGGGSAHST